MTDHVTDISPTDKTETIGITLPSLGRSARRRLGDALTYIILGFGLIFTLLPFIWMLSASFKLESEILIYPPKLWPDPWNLGNYGYILTQTLFPRWILNSLIICCVTIPAHLISGSLVAFGFARLRFPGRNVLFLVVLSTIMIPFQAYMIPRFEIMKRLRVLDTLLAVVLPYLFGGPFYIFLMRQYFMTLPRELDDAARIDGCNTFQIYLRILLPLARPILATVTVIEFLAAWNSFLEPLVYLNSMENYTVALGLSLFRQGWGGQVHWGPMMAATALSALSPLVVCFAAQKQLMGGIAVTGTSG